MTWEARATLVLVGAVAALLVLEIASPALVMLLALTALMTLGIITPELAFAGFGSLPVALVATLLVLAAGARRTGVLERLAQAVLGWGGERWALVRLLVPSAVLSAFLNNTPVVALFAPAVLDWCKRHNFAPSRFLMPLSFATMLGGMCTLIGTSTTLVVDGLIRERGLPGLGMFETAWVGVPVLLCGLGVIWLLAGRVLPDRRDPVQGMRRESRSYLVEMEVVADSDLIGRTIEQVGLRNLPGLYLANIERHGVLRRAAPGDVLLGGDRLVFTGVASTVADLRRFPGLVPAPDVHYDPTESRAPSGLRASATLVREGSKVTRAASETGELVAGQSMLYEAVVSASSPLVGATLKAIGFRSRYDAAVLAVHRSGERLPEKLGQVVLRPGDTLMLESGPEFGARWAESTDFALVARTRADDPPVAQHLGRRTLVVMGLLVAAVALELVPLIVAACLGIIALLAFKVLSGRTLRRALDLNVVTVIAGAMALGAALEHTGAARHLAMELLGVVRGYLGTAPEALSATGYAPLAFLVLCYGLAVLCSELMTNVAAAALVLPIAFAAAEVGHWESRPFAIVVAIAASASFLTPTGYQTNLMVYGPGGYRFGDFARLGAPLQLVVCVVTLGVVPLVWPF